MNTIFRSEQSRILSVIRLFWLIFAVGLVAGCLEYTESIDVGIFGGATLTINVKVNSLMYSLNSNEESPFNDLKGIKTKLPQSMKLIGMTESDTGGSHIVDLKIKIDDIEKLANDGEFPKMKLFRKHTVSMKKNNDGSISFVRTIDNTENANDRTSSLFRKLGSTGMLKARMTFSLKVPTRIISTNGDLTGTRQATWSFPVGNFMGGKTVMEAKIAGPGKIIWMLIGAGIAGVAFLTLVIYLIIRRLKARKRNGVGTTL